MLYSNVVSRLFRWTLIVGGSTATSCVYTRCESLCARRCAGHRFPVELPSLLDRIHVRMRAAFAREEAPSPIHDAAILERVYGRPYQQGAALPVLPILVGSRAIRELRPRCDVRED